MKMKTLRSWIVKIIAVLIVVALVAAGFIVILWK